MSLSISQPLFDTKLEGDKSVLFGVGLGLLIIALAISLGGKVSQFIDLTGVLLVAGGTFAATLATFSLSEMGFAWNYLIQTVRFSTCSPIKRIRQLASINQAVRSEGPLVVDHAARIEREPFMRKALELVADGTSIDDVRRILETEMRSGHERSAKAVQVYETLGAYAPALGLIGTLVGLVKMLGALNDPTLVGPAMGLALLTTLYGALAANLIFLPIAGKLKNRSEEERVLKSIALEGAISLARQENTIVMEQRLYSFLPTK